MFKLKVGFIVVQHHFFSR